MRKNFKFFDVLGVYVMYVVLTGFMSMQSRVIIEEGA